MSVSGWNISLQGVAQMLFNATLIYLLRQTKMILVLRHLNKTNIIPK